MRLKSSIPKPKFVLIAILLGILAGIIFCITIWWQLNEIWGNPIPPAQPAIETSKAILEAAATPGQIPPSLSSIHLFSLERCWNLLQELIQENRNQYEIVVKGVFGDAGTKIPGTGTTDISLEVVFPNGSRVKMQYYAYTLTLCKEVKYHLFS